MNTYLRKIKKNSKALSPVIASIILIAVTVAVSVVVAAWMGGMTIGLMGNAETVSITNIGFSQTAGADSLTITVSNTGKSQVTITNAYVNTVAIITSTPSLPLATPIGSETSVNIVLTGAEATWNSGDEITVKMTTAEGNNIVLSAFAP